MGAPVRDSYGGSLHERSHGEAFLSLLKNRLGGQGLYLFDEPEAALSPARLLAMLALMHGLIENGSQLIIATHSPILMAYPGAWIYELDDAGIRRADYRDTQHYQLTRRFLEAPERYFRHLWDDGGMER